MSPVEEAQLERLLENNSVCDILDAVARLCDQQAQATPFHASAYRRVAYDVRTAAETALTAGAWHLLTEDA